MNCENVTVGGASHAPPAGITTVTSFDSVLAPAAFTATTRKKNVLAGTGPAENVVPRTGIDASVTPAVKPTRSW